nr:hypothetical protein [Paraburkholderia adhaesiva]
MARFSIYVTFPGCSHAAAPNALPERLAAIDRQAPRDRPLILAAKIRLVRNGDMDVIVCIDAKLIDPARPDVEQQPVERLDLCGIFTDRLNQLHAFARSRRVRLDEEVNGVLSRHENAVHHLPPI